MPLSVRIERMKLSRPGQQLMEALDALRKSAREQGISYTAEEINQEIARIRREVKSKKRTYAGRNPPSR